MLSWLLLLLLLPAHAHDALNFSAIRVVEHGKAAPSVTFQPGVDGSLDVDLTCGPQRYTLSRPLKRGVPVTLELTGLPPGPWDCSGQVHLEVASGGTASMPLSLQVASLELISWEYSLDDVDLAAHTLVTHPSRPLTQASLDVLGVGGQRLDSVLADLSDPSQPRFRWNADGEVVKLVVEGVDAYGFKGILELSPWSYEIPHEDVVFASGSHEITAPEAPKLEATWAETVAVLEKYGSVVEIELFVAGYTDTVGPAASNQALSERRARAIAQWFRQRGFAGKIWYQGFGEEAQAVQTGDEVDEPRNRRALYVLAAQTPPVSEHLPRQAWKAL